MTNTYESMDPHDRLVMTEPMTRVNRGSSRLTSAQSESKQLDGENMAFQLVQRRLGEGKAHMTVTDSYGTWMTPVTLAVSVTTPHREISRSSRGQYEDKGQDDLSSVDPAGRKFYQSKDSELRTAKCWIGRTGTRRCDASSRRAGKYGPQLETSSAQSEISQKESSISATSTSVADGRDCHPNITSKHIKRVANSCRKSLPSCSQRSIAACQLGGPVQKKRVRFKDVCEESNSPAPSSSEYGPCTLVNFADLSLVQSQNRHSQIAGPCRRTRMAKFRPNYECPSSSWNLHDDSRRVPFPSGSHRISMEKLAIRSIQIAGREPKIRFSKVIQTFDPRVYESLQENPDGCGEVDDNDPRSSRNSYVCPRTDDPKCPPPSPPSSPSRCSLQTDQLFTQLPPPSPSYRDKLSDRKRRSILRNRSLEQDLPLRLGRSKSVTFDESSDRMPLQLSRSKHVGFDEAPIQNITLLQGPPISSYQMGEQFSDVLYDQGPVNQFNDDFEQRLGRSPCQVPFDGEVCGERDSPLRRRTSNSGTFGQFGMRPPPQAPLEMPISPYEMAEQFSDFWDDCEPVDFSQGTSRFGRAQSFDEVPERAEGSLRWERSCCVDELPHDSSFMRPPPLEIPTSPYEIDERFSDVYHDRRSLDFSQEPHGQEEPIRRNSFPDYYTSERESVVEESSPNRADSDKAKLDFRQKLYQQTQETEDTIFDLLSRTNAASKDLEALERQERLSGHLQLKELGKDSCRPRDEGNTRSSLSRIDDMSRARHLSLLSRGMKEVNPTFDYNFNDRRRASSSATCEYCVDAANPGATIVGTKTITEADIYELIENFQVEMMKLMGRTDGSFTSEEEEPSYNDEVNDGIPAAAAAGGRE